MDPSRPLKVLMINTVPTALNGVTAVMLNYAENMDLSGMQLDFVTINDVEPSLRAGMEALGAKVYVLKGRTRRPLRYMAALRRVIEEGGYQIVHAHGNSCTLAAEMLAAKRAGTPVRCPHSHNTQTTNPAAHRLLRPLFDGSYTHAFACGDAAGRWLYRDRPFTVLNNGIRASRFRFDEENRRLYRAKLGVEGRKVIGHVGSFNTQKNHLFLISAFARALQRDNNLALVLVGDGKRRAEAEARAQALGVAERVIFTGASREVPQLLSAMDVMALPSLYEGFPNVLVEWQCAGLPALVADTVTPECRLTELVSFLPLDEKAWAQALAGTAPTPDRPRASEEAARQVTAAGYDIQASAAKLRELYFEYAGR